jgi:hypothetical protein
MTLLLVEEETSSPCAKYATTEGNILRPAESSTIVTEPRTLKPTAE